MDNSPPGRVVGWKDIACHLGRSVRTAQRWEREFSLPVRRLSGAAGTTVLAHLDELDAWRQSSRGRAALMAEGPDADHPAPPRDVGAESQVTASSRGVSPPVSSRDATGAQPRPVMAMPTWPDSRLRRSAILAGTGVAVCLAMLWTTRAGTSGPALVCPDDCIVRQGETIVLRAVASGHVGAWLRTITSETGHVESFRPVLHPDESGVVTWGFTTDCTSRPGVYDLHLTDEGMRTKTNAVRVRIAPEPSCDRPVADLVAEGVALDRTAATVGEALVCRFTLRNQGAAAAPASITRVRIGRSADRTAVTDHVLADVPAPSIAVAESVTLTHTVRVPEDLPPSTGYYVWVVADNGSAMVERLGTNNFARSSELTVHPRP